MPLGFDPERLWRRIMWQTVGINLIGTAALIFIAAYVLDHCAGK